MAAESFSVPHVQAKFFTKQKKYSIPDTPYSVPANIGTDELSSLVNSILKQGQDGLGSVNFDFIIDGEFLRVPLEKHMQSKEVSYETVLEIEYVESNPAPEPEDSLQHDDWVAAIQGNGDFILTGSYDNTLQIWNTEGEQLIVIPGHISPVKCVAWVHNAEDNTKKTFISGSHDETALVWQWHQSNNSVDCLYTCKGHAASVDTLALNPSNTQFCTGSWDKMLKIWSASTTEVESESGDDGDKPQKKKKKTDATKVPTRVPLMTLAGHSEGVSSSLWLDETTICTGSWDHSIKLWDLSQAAEKSNIQATKVIFDISYSELNKTLIAGSSDRHVRLYDPRATDGSVVQSVFTSHTAWVSTVAWSKTNEFQFVSGGYDNSVKLWDTRSPKTPLFNMSGHEDKVLALDWSIPQYILSGGADNSLKIFKNMDKNVRGMQDAEAME